MPERKGVLAKGVSVESSVAAKETKNTQGIGPSSTFGTQSATAERGVHFAEILSENPLFLVSEYCAIPRDYLSETPPIARYGVFGVSTRPIGCDTPSSFSERFPLWRTCKVEVRPPPPPQKGYLSDTCAIPYENKANGCDTPPSAILSRKGIARYGGVSRTGTGPLSARSHTESPPLRV